MKKARAMAVLVIVAVLVCAAFAISKNSAEKRKQMIAQKYGITQENTKNVNQNRKKMYAKPRKAIQKLKKVRRKFRKALSYRGKMKQGIH